MISNEMLMATQKAINSMAAEEEEKIVISQRSYAALEMIVDRLEKTGKEWQSFPDIDPVNKYNKYNSLKELVDTKKVLQVRKQGSETLVKLSVPWDRILPSKNGSLPPGITIKLPGFTQEPPKRRAGTTLAVPTNGHIKSTDLATIETKEPVKMRVLNNPVSRGGYKATFHTLEDFVKDVKAMATLHSEDQFNRINREMNDIIRRLPQARGGEQDKLIEILYQMSRQRRACTSTAYTDAIKDVSAEERYARFNFEDMLSINPEDYADGSFN
jgi:hypothetical protein